VQLNRAFLIRRSLPKRNPSKTIRFLLVVLTACPQPVDKRTCALLDGGHGIEDDVLAELPPHKLNAGR
jgi:hypothetical protein